MKLRLLATLLLVISLLAAIGAALACVSRAVRGTGFLPGDVALLGTLAAVCAVAGRAVRAAARAAALDERF